MSENEIQRDGGFTEEELKYQKSFEQYEAWIKWWTDMFPRRDK